MARRTYEYRKGRTGFYGANKLRKTLRRADPETTKSLRATFAEGAEAIAQDARGIAYSKGIQDQGDMIHSIEVKMGRDGLTAVIGPGAKRVRISKSPFNTTLYVKDKDKYEAWQFFKGYWAEFGTKGTPDRNIPPQAPRPFMQPAYDLNKQKISWGVKKGVSGVLVKLAARDG